MRCITLNTPREPVFNFQRFFTTVGIRAITLDRLRGGLFAKAITCITLFFFTFVFYANPAAAAVANEMNKDDQREAALEVAIETTPEKKLSHRLAKLRDKIVLDCRERLSSVTPNRMGSKVVSPAFLAMILSLLMSLLNLDR